MFADKHTTPLLSRFRFTPQTRKGPHAKKYFMVFVTYMNTFVGSYTGIIGLVFLAAWLRSSAFAIVCSLIIVPAFQWGMVALGRTFMQRAVAHANLAEPDGGSASEPVAALYGSIFLTLLGLMDIDESAERSVDPLLLAALLLSPFPAIVGRHYWLRRQFEMVKGANELDAAKLRSNIRASLLRRTHDYWAGIMAPIGVGAITLVVILGPNTEQYYLFECLSRDDLAVIVLMCVVQLCGELVAVFVEGLVLKLEDRTGGLLSDAVSAYEDGCKEFDVLRFLLGLMTAMYMVACFFVKIDGIAVLGDLLECHGGASGM